MKSSVALRLSPRLLAAARADSAAGPEARKARVLSLTPEPHCQRRARAAPNHRSASPRSSYGLASRSSRIGLNMTPSTHSSWRQYALATDTLAREARPLGVADRSLVEAVDLQLEPVVAEVEEQVALENRAASSASRRPR